MAAHRMAVRRRMAAPRAAPTDVPTPATSALTHRAARERHRPPQQIGANTMDTELTELAVAAGSVLIKAATAQGWEAAKKAVLGLWRSHAPAQAETIEAGLDTLHAQPAEASEARGARSAGDPNGVPPGHL